MGRSHLYTLYIDETGIRYPKHKGNPRDDGMDWFGWAGILVAEDDESGIISEFKALREKWKIDYPLHSTEIRGKREKFSWLADEDVRSRFFTDLNKFLCSAPVLGFGVVVSRPGYNARYREKYGDGRWELCKSAHPILVERVVRYLLRIDAEARLRIVFEGSRGSANKQIVGYTRDLRRDGHPFQRETALKYTPLVPRVYDQIIVGDAEWAPKSNYFLQIADLYAYPIAKRKYDISYRAWVILYDAQRVIDALISPAERDMDGIKYYCFDEDERKIE